LLLKLFPMVLKNIDGDAKVDLMSMYADFLENNKLKTAEEIKQIRDGRESVANISLKKKFEIQIFNNELETADQIAEKMLKEQGTDKFDYNSVISAFSSKKVFGSQYAKKWYDQYLPIIHGD